MEPPVLRATQLGPYRLQEALGAGAMGTVYRAEADDGPVALKVIHSHLLERSGYFKRFQREAEAGRRVEHPNVVRTLDCDLLMVEGEPYFFLVMEYVEGKTLRELLIEARSMSEALTREIGRQIAAGLAAIHEAGIVHRDVKPENVLITDDHRVRIMDLGVARIEDAATQLTAEGHFAGSLGYAAPEQFRRETIGPAADLYALGVLLYELVSGTNPFRHDGAAAVMRAHLEEVPPALDGRDPDVSLFFAALVATLLAKRPGERFESADALSRTLETGEESGWWQSRERSLLEERTRRVRVPVRRETALYGREADLALLQDAWARAKAGDGNTVLLEGEAGIGKSRLVDAFLGDLNGEDAHVLYGSYAPSGGTGAISDALLAHFGHAGLEIALADHLTVTPWLVPALAAYLRREVPPEVALPLQSGALHTVFTHLMRSLAEERPLAWVLEDLHFADADSRELVLSLARAVEGHPILLCLTTRPGAAEAELERLGHLENLARTGLRRLGAREVVLLLEDAFQSKRLAEKLGGKIALKSDGVPFFVFEMIRGLREGQFITQLPDGSWIESRVIEDVDVPSSVVDLVNARMADLAPEDRNLLDLASCCGFEFDPGLVADAAGVAPIPALQRIGHVERSHGLIRSRGRMYAFDHHQVQETLYRALNAQLREAYHAAIGESLEAREHAAGKDLDALEGVSCVLLCEHFLKGLQDGRALRYLDAALDHLRASSQSGREIALADRVLSVRGLLDDDRRVRILLEKSEALYLLGRSGDMEHVLEEARTLAQRGCDRGLSARVDMATGHLLRRLGRLEEALRHVERGLSTFREVGDRESEGGAMGGLGSVYLSLGRFEEAKAHHERALEIAQETGDRRTEAGQIVNLGSVLTKMGRYEEARTHFERGLRVCREVGERALEVIAMGNLGSLSLRLGRLEQAKDQHEQVLEIARETGNRHLEAGSTVNLGMVLQELGQLEEARTRYERGLALCREIGHREFESNAVGSLGLVLQEIGRHEEARGCFERSLAIAREIGSRSNEGRALVGLGDLHLALGCCGPAERYYEQALAITGEIGDRRGEALSAGGLANVCSSLDRIEEAGAHFERALVIMREMGDRNGEAVALVNLGPLWLALGQTVRARQALVASLALCRETGARYVEGYALLGLSRLAGEEDDVAEALETARESLALRQEVGREDGIASSLIQLGETHWRAGDPDVSRETLHQAVDLLRQQHPRAELTLALALLACLPEGDVEAAEAALEEAGNEGDTDQVRFLLWKATSDPEHLAEAKRLLDYRVEHAPEEYRESMLKNVRLHREIMEAWASLDPELVEGEHGEGASG